MGSFPSAPNGVHTRVMFESNEDIPGQSRTVLLMSKELGYSVEDIDRMFSFFSASEDMIDGLVPISFFSSEHECLSESLVRLVLKLFSADESNSVNFEEFMVASWNLLTVRDNHAELTSFLFNLFDHSNRGVTSNINRYVRSTLFSLLNNI